MNILRDRSIRFKLIAPPLIVLVGFLLLSLMLMYRQNRITAIHNQASSTIFSRILLIDDLVILSEQVNSDVFHIAVVGFSNQGPAKLIALQDRLENRLSELNILFGQIYTYWEPDLREKRLL